MAYKATCEKEKGDCLISERILTTPSGFLPKYGHILLGIAVIDIALCWTIFFQIGYKAFNATTIAPIVIIYMYSVMIATVFIGPWVVMLLLIVDSCYMSMSLYTDRDI